MFIINILILFLFLFFSCENPISNQPVSNCVADQGGFIDDCGICSGGTSSHVANSDKDCGTFTVNINSQQRIINGFSSTGAIIPPGNNLILTIFENSIEKDCIDYFLFKTLGGNILSATWIAGNNCDFNQSTESIDDDYDLCLELENNTNLNYSTLFDIVDFKIYYSDDKGCEINKVSGGESDIDGVCFGEMVVDDCGVCGGTCFNPIENIEDGENQPEGCLECGCFETRGTCSTCSGPDEPYCDCNGNQLDECGVCNGGGYNDWDCNDGLETCWNIEEGSCDCYGNKYDCDDNCFACLQLEEENCNGDCIWIAEPGNGIEPYCRNNLLFEEDECGVCDDNLDNNCIQDCDGDWGGNSIIDNCGVCDGNNSCECSLPFPQGFFIGEQSSDDNSQPIPNGSDITLLKLENNNLDALNQECLSNFIFSSNRCAAINDESNCLSLEGCTWYQNPGSNVGHNIEAYCGGDLTFNWGTGCDENICLSLEDDENSQIYKNLNYTSEEDIAKFQFRHNGCILDYEVPQGNIPQNFLTNLYTQTLKDCIGVCGGYAEIDECNVCNGDGLGERECCDGSIKDCAGECAEIFINNTWTPNPNYDSNNILIFDDCFICGGNNFGSVGPQMDDFGTCCSLGICHDDYINADLEEYDNAQDCITDGYSWIIEKDCAGICGDSAVYDCTFDPYDDNTWESSCGGSLVVDCAGECGGFAVYDCTYDLNDDNTWESSCGGLAVEDECGVCNGSNDCDCPGSFDDCGVCNGTGVDVDDDDICDDVDDCVGEFIEIIDIGNICCSPSSIYTETIDDIDVTQCCISGIFDCLGQCDGGAVFDSCGICDGDNDYPCDFDGDGIFCDEFPQEDCDCLGHEYDECGVCDGPGPLTNYDCFGNCSTGLDCNGDCIGTITDSDGEPIPAFLDQCGECVSGNTICVIDDEIVIPCEENFNQDLCGVCNGNNTSCKIGLLTLNPQWNFNQINLYNSNDCSGFPYYSFNDAICLDGICYDYSFEFVYSPGIASNGTFIQTTIIYQQEVGSSINEFSGTWTLTNSQLCINYSSAFESELEDFCYESLEFENGYYDCINNLEYCVNNSATFTNININDNLCSKEIYSFDDNIILNNNNDASINIENLPTPLQNMILFHQSNNQNIK